MPQIEGRIAQVKLKSDIECIKPGERYRTDGLWLWIRNMRKETYALIPIKEIPNNPIEERRLQSELEKQKAMYETDQSHIEGVLRQRITLTVKSGRLKGLILEYNGDPVNDDY